MARRLLLLAPLFVLLVGCDQLGIESASATAARQEADGKAVGAACRHAGRAIEDCFSLNRRVDKAAIYAGWREMDDYMRENKEEVVAPVLAPGGTKHADAGAPAADDDAGEKAAPADAKAKPEGKAERGAKGEKSSKADEAASGDKTAKAEGDRSAKAEPDRSARAEPDKSAKAEPDKSAKADGAGKTEKVATRDSGAAADKGASEH